MTPPPFATDGVDKRWNARLAGPFESPDRRMLGGKAAAMVVGRLVGNRPTAQTCGMSVCRTVTASITQDQDDLLRSCLRSDHYRFVSEVVRSALRLLQRNEAAALNAIKSSAAGKDTAVE